MKNLNLEKTISKEDVRMIYKYTIGELDDYIANELSEEQRENEDIQMKIKEITEKIDDLSDIFNKVTMGLLDCLYDYIDISNPYLCYDFIRELEEEIKPTDDDYEYKKIKIEHIKIVLGIQFGSNWVDRLLEEKNTVDKLLKENPEVSPSDRKQLCKLAEDIDFNTFVALSTCEDEQAEELKYQYNALMNYVDCNLK